MTHNLTKRFPPTGVVCSDLNESSSDRDHINGKIHCVAIQQATISLTEAIQPGDVKHFSGDRYSQEYYGIPWMFGFDPGVLRKVVIKDTQLVSEEAFMHPGWFSTTLYTADPRELFNQEGYFAIYQVYAGYHRDLICRRQYLSFRDHENRILTDKQLPQTAGFYGLVPSLQDTREQFDAVSLLLHPFDSLVPGISGLPLLVECFHCMALSFLDVIGALGECNASVVHVSVVVDGSKKMMLPRLGQAWLLLRLYTATGRRHG